MIRTVTAYVLTLLMVLTSLSLAGARGTNPDIGTEMVICSGVTMTTILIGADGQPIEQTHVCPDGTSLFAAEFTLPAVELPAPVLLGLPALAQPAQLFTRNELTPSARGPPSLA